MAAASITSRRLAETASIEARTDVWAWKRPLAVDLDGTLLRSDVLHEDLTTYLMAYPWGLGRIVLTAVRRGPAALKELVADAPGFNPSSLPSDERVIDWLRRERSSGRTIVLATATSERRARLIADHLGLFDDVLATSVDVNLKSLRKRDLLVRRYGAGGYDYLGNHRDDLPVWASADEARVVGGQRLVDAAGKVAQVGWVIPPDQSRIEALTRLLRPQQWPENLPVLSHSSLRTISDTSIRCCER